MEAVEIPIPKGWPEVVKSGTLQVVALAQYALSFTRAWALCGRNGRARHKAELQLRDDRNAQLEEQVRLLLARCGRIEALRRTHYLPVERLAILQLKAARGWNNAECARQMLLSAQTIADWMKCIDDPKGKLFRTATPVNKFPDYVEEIVLRLKALSPSLGAKKVDQVLAKSGLHLALSTVKRMLKRPAKPPKDGDKQKQKLPGGAALEAELLRRVTSKRPGHIWLCDITVMPVFFGFCVPWWPFSVPTVWPFCWHIIGVKDHFSRMVLGTKLCREMPSAGEVCALLTECAKKHGAPKYIITDQGSQFASKYRKWCKRHGVTPRFGAIGQHGSIALMERFWRSLKSEWLRVVPLSTRAETMRPLMSEYLIWFNEHRPHEGIRGATPCEVFSKRRPARDGPRWEPRKRFPLGRKPCAGAPDKVRGKRGVVLEMRVTHLGGNGRLPVVELTPVRRAA